jgi:hypothetical protein
MKTLQAFLFLLCLSGSLVISAQDRTQAVCKGSPVPDGFVISGETISSSCSGTAWIIKPRPGARGTTERQPPAIVSSSTGSNEKEIAPGQCAKFQELIRKTYNFNPAQMNETQIKDQSARLDTFWGHVRGSQATLLPCLRQALADEKTGSFFNIDGSMLLVDIDPSTRSKALQVKKFIQADLDGTDLEYWVKTMARRGLEGFDTSEAGAKWLSYPKAKYTLSMHGDYPIGSFLGAVFIFGSMEEEFATPVLLRIVNDLGHPHRDDALAILMSQATPASLRALKQVNTAGFPAGTDKSIRELLENPSLLKPRAHPKLTREEQLRAFQGIIDGDYSAFREMVMKSPDGEVDALATLKPEDIPLLRRARRASISRCSQHAVSDYASFTGILWALTWEPQLGK